MSRELVDLTMREHHRTKAAILVSDDGVEKNAVWLPLSQVEVAPVPGSGAARGLVLVTLPEWLAVERGLV